MATISNTVRFSNRVDNYVKYRPGYPVEIISFLKKEGVLENTGIIADVGSGTGISSELFLKNGHKVFGIEPNTEMRKAAEKLLSGYSDFVSINAKAESTELPTGSIDLVVAGQAFHWFDKEKSKTEFKRILKKNGAVLLMWNDRKTDTTTFLKNYESFLMKYGTDYAEVNHKNVDEKIFDGFFGAGNYKLKVFHNEQKFDFEGLKGRVLSSSYMPDEQYPTFNEMIEELKSLFDQFRKEGKIVLEYDTKIYYSRLI